MVLKQKRLLRKDIKRQQQFYCFTPNSTDGSAFIRVKWRFLICGVSFLENLVSLLCSTFLSWLLNFEPLISSKSVCLCLIVQSVACSVVYLAGAVYETRHQNRPAGPVSGKIGFLLIGRSGAGREEKIETRSLVPPGCTKRSGIRFNLPPECWAARTNRVWPSSSNFDSIF